jgi:PAS domain S-box-containing protein
MRPPEMIDYLKTVIDNIPDGIIAADAKGEILLFNPAAEKMLGISRKNFNSAGWAAAGAFFLPDGITPCPLERLPLFKAARGENSDEELLLVRNSRVPSGSWVRVSGRSLKNEAGEVRGAIAVFRDISECRELNEKINGYRRLCSALEQTADSVIITDTKGNIEYVNKAFETTTGFSSSEALGKTPRLLKSGKQGESFYRELWQKLLAGCPFRGTIVNKRKTGELYWAQQTITPIKDENGQITHFVSVLKDISDLIERKEQEARLHIAREVQQRFYRIAASLPGYDIAGSAYPLEETGGDYFDFIEMPDRRLCIAVGDVCGHGIGAALLMAETRAYLRSVALDGHTAAEIMNRVNRCIIPDLDDGQFVTLLLCCLDAETGTLTYASAGHVPGFLFDKSGEVRLALGGTGPPLGLFSDSRYSSQTFPFSETGQVLLLPTDGITESLSLEDSTSGVARTIGYMRENRHKSAKNIVRGLYREARIGAENSGRLDDITAVVVKVT